jgi:hypothetical protein
MTLYLYHMLNNIIKGGSVTRSMVWPVGRLSD